MNARAGMAVSAFVVLGSVLSSGCGMVRFGGRDGGVPDLSPVAREQRRAHRPLVGATGILDASRRIDWSGAGVEGGIPSWPVVASVLDYGARGDDGGDDSAAFQAAIDNVPFGSAVRVPAGTYHLRESLHMRSGVVLRGDGAGRTRLEIEHDDHAVEFVATGEGTDVAVTGGLSKGSRSLRVADASQFEAGDYADLTQANDASVMYTREAWNVSWAQRVTGQIVRVTSVEGDTLHLAEPLNMEFEWSEPRIRPQAMIEQAGVESLTLDKNALGQNMFRLRQAANVWIRNVVSLQPHLRQVFARRSYHCEIRGSLFDNSGDINAVIGVDYGIDLSYRTTGCLVEDNVLYRHALSLVVTRGATGNVFGYNYAPDAKGTYEDVSLQSALSLHGHYPFANLYEGNIVQRASVGDWWGPAGPWNTYLRNLVTEADFEIFDASDYQNVIGNVIPTRSFSYQVDWRTITTSPDLSTLIRHGNLVQGEVDDDPSVPDGTPVPASYYHPDKPAFYGDMAWPSIGPRVGAGSNPAKQRFLNNVPTAE